MGTTGTGNIKPLVCSRYYMNEQQERKEGAVSSGAQEHGGMRVGLLRGTGVTSSGAAPCRDRQTLPGCLSPALPPCTAHGHVVPCLHWTGCVAGHPGVSAGG